MSGAGGSRGGVRCRGGAMQRRGNAPSFGDFFFLWPSPFAFSMGFFAFSMGFAFTLVRLGDRFVALAFTICA